MPSIDDVAALAGVSPTTVSHAISGKRKVSDAVTTRVRRAMDELGYVPSRSAQSLALGSTRILGLIIPDISSGFFAQLAKGVETIAVRNGYNVLFCTTGFDHQRELVSLEMIRSRAVDGIVYAAGAPPSGSKLMNVLGDLPAVLVDEEVPGANLPTFVSDNRDGGSQAADFLLSLGHQRVLIISGNQDLESSRKRVAGFVDAWRAGGGEEPQVVVGGFTEDGGRAAVVANIEAFASGKKTAIFTANDLMALGAMDALRGASVSVPHQVSVIGFDDIDVARYTRPRLTTVRQDVAALGEYATEWLIDSMTGSKDSSLKRQVVPVQLVPRASTGRARTMPPP